MKDDPDEEYFHDQPLFTISSEAGRFQDAYSKIDEVFSNFSHDWKVPGISYGVVVGSELVYDASVGVADITNERTPDRDTVFRIASMTKSFTAMSLLMLRDDSRIKLDDPAEMYVPELAGLLLPTRDSPQVTIRHLLSMSSGLVEDDPWGDRLLDLDAKSFREILAAGITFDQVPGTTYEYSNLGYAILGQVFPSAAGESLRDFAERRIFSALDMSSTTWDADLIEPDRAATGYRIEAGEWAIEPRLPDGAFGAMGGIASTVSDLAKYIACHLAAWPPRNDAESGPIKRSSLREMAQMHRAGLAHQIDDEFTGGGSAFVGYGFGLASSVHSSFGKIVSHSGGLPGFSSHMEWLPDQGVGVVALANRTYVPIKRAVRAAISELATTNSLVPRSIPPSTALIRIKDAIAELYRHWDDALAQRTFLSTYFLDLDDTRRWPDFALLKEQYGPCHSVSEVTPTGALRGTWTMHCDSVDLMVTAMLGPSVPSKVQFLTIEPVE